MTLSEYPRELNSYPNNVKIEIRSEHYQKADTLTIENLSVTPGKDDSDVTKTTFKCTGRLIQNGEIIKLSYVESADTEIDNTTTILTFVKNEPDSVFVERKGQINSSFYIKKGVRNIGIYSVPYGKFNIATFGTEVSFDFKGNLGLIKLNYLLEIQGMTAQKSKMTIKTVKTCK